jgi:PAS domain S-box-containing protein
LALNFLADQDRKWSTSVPELQNGGAVVNRDIVRKTVQKKSSGTDAEVGERTALLPALGDERSLRLIKQAHREWLTALDAIQDPIFIHDREFRVLRSNLAYAERAGMSVKEVIGKPYYEMFPRHDGPLPECREFSDGITEEEVSPGDGRIYLSRAVAVKDDDGNYVYSLHIMYDITERKQLEGRLHASETNYRLLFESSRDALTTLALPSGKFSNANAAALKLFGVNSEAEFITLAPWEVSPKRQPDGRPSAEKAQEMIAIAIDEGSNLFEWEHQRLDGQPFAAEVLLTRMEVGEELFLQATVRDITERKRGEETLRASRNLLIHVVENAPIRVFWKDAKLRYLGCNTAFARDAGMSRPEDLLGKDDFQMGWRDQAELYRADDKKVMDSDTPKLGYEEPQTTPDGRTIWLRTSKVPLRDSTGKVFGIVGIYDDITERKRNEENLLRLNLALKTLSECNQTLIFAEDEMQLLRDMCWVIVETGGFQGAWVGYAQNDAQKTIRPMAQHGLDEGELGTLSLTWGKDGNLQQCLAGRAVNSGRTQIVQDIANDPCFDVWRKQTKQLNIGSAIAFPLKDGGKVFGSLDIYAQGVGAIKEAEVRLLQELADDLAFGIGTMRLRREQEQSTVQLRNALEGTVQAVAAMVEMRDPYTSGHQQRVAELAVAIATEMGLPEEQIRGIHFAGVIHDLGKIHVPAEILSKPGRLNDAEFALIKSHPQTGYDVLKNIRFPWPIAQIVLQHHERLDGSGYPNGLKGDEILLEARILGVADAVEAMASHRPYRPGLGLPAALEEIRRNSGKLYDPDVVKACVAIFEKNRFTLPETWAKH